jgi:putative ABC transport system substrate-binding protein
MIGRREFITLLAMTPAAAWPLAVRAQQSGSKLPKVGFLQGSENENVAAFIQALRAAGYTDGQNVQIETRIYATMLDRLGEFARELIDLRCSVIVAAGPYAIRAVTRATSTVPVVGIDLESDPVAIGWAKSLSRPRGNLTGLFLDIPELGGKQIELLREAVPTFSHLGVLWDAAIGSVQFRATEAAARGAQIELHSLPIQRAEDIDTVFGRAVSERVDGVVILSSPLINRERLHIADLTLKNRLPTISLFTDFPKSGALMAYGPNLPDMYRRAAVYVDRILKGIKVIDLPIERPSRFELVINLKTAKALGLDIPPSLLARADEVIE